MESENLDNIFLPYSTEELVRRLLPDVLGVLGEHHLWDDAADYWLKVVFYPSQPVVDRLIEELNRLGKIAVRHNKHKEYFVGYMDNDA
jgi:hypothetical protein